MVGLPFTKRLQDEWRYLLIVNERERKRRAIESLPELIAIVGEVLDLSSYVGSLRITTGNVRNDTRARAGFMAVSFVSKQDEHLRSLRILVRAGQHRDAFLIARTMIEGLTQLLWSFNNQPNGPDEWFWYGAIEDWRQLNENKANGLEVDPEAQALAQQLLDAYGSHYYTSKALRKAKDGAPLPADPYRRKWISLDAAAVFEKTRGSDLYEAVYREASDWIHWSPRSMLLGISDEGEVQKHKIDDPPRASQALAAGVLSLLQSLEVLDNHFQTGINGELAKLYEKFYGVLRLVDKE